MPEGRVDQPIVMKPATERASAGRRDVALLLVGALIGVVPGVLTAHLQAEAQLDQMLLERKHLLLREALEVHHSSATKLESKLSRGYEIYEGLTVDAWDNRESPFSASLRRHSDEVEAERLAYESKIEPYLILLQAAFNKPTSNLRLRHSVADPAGQEVADLADRLYEEKDSQSRERLAALVRQKAAKLTESLVTQIRADKERVNKEFANFALSAFKAK